MGDAEVGETVGDAVGLNEDDNVGDTESSQTTPQHEAAQFANITASMTAVSWQHSVLSVGQF